MNPPRQSILVAIVGGSGAGKSRLAEQLESALGRDAARLSLDDFYRDRSKLSAARRARINFDHPRAIDWQGVAQAVGALAAGEAAHIPCYDFKTHCRTTRRRTIEPKAFILMEGLWLLRRPSLRKLFDVGLFIDCPARTRWRRRLARDVKSRGRTRDSIREQFRRTVEPMHQRFVESQRRWADRIVKSNFSGQDARQLAEQLRAGSIRCNPENTEYETANERRNITRLKRGRTQRHQRQRLSR